MASITVSNLTFTYPKKPMPALRDLSFSIEYGEFVTICGHSGCGKTTLLRHLKPSLAPHGERSGEILFEGKPLFSLDQRSQSEKIGFVMQNPDNQIVTDKVWHELSFSLESLGCDSNSIRLKVAEMASFFGIHAWFHKNVSELSGGQKQILNLASVMAAHPSALILDEPTSQLDPIAASDFLSVVGKINRELGVTVVMTEHRLEEAFSLSDRVLVMNAGGIIADGTPKDVGTMLRDSGNTMFAAMPVPMRVYARVDNVFECPVTVREGRDWLGRIAKTRPLNAEFCTGEPPPDNAGCGTEAAVEISDAWFRYDKNSPDVVKGLSLKVDRGDFYCIMGGNGTGKTTVLSLISGINRPHRGSIKLFGGELSKYGGNTLFENMLGVLPQNPQTVFACKTVKEELLEMVSRRGYTDSEKNRELFRAARLCRLESLLEEHPYDLSGGEQQRAALAKILLLRPKVLLLDEPTKGMDAEFKQVFAEILGNLSREGATVIMVSHDIEFCAEHAGKCGLFFDGDIVSSDYPRGFFSGNSFYTTSANRMARTLLPNAITADDIIIACGGTPPKKADLDVETYISAETKDEQTHKKDQCENPAADAETQPTTRQSRGKPISRRTLAATVIMLLAIPLTIYIGVNFLGDRKYYFICLLIILETMTPFLLAFENRKPQARELVVISVLCAAAVAGRAAFFMIPQFKLITALIIIAGVAFGGETGFLVGAASGFVSNFFFGQGPWTPWQMFAFGVIGFLSGILFHGGTVRRGRVTLSVFGAFSSFFIFGGVMNAYTVFTNQLQPTWEMVFLTYLYAVPFDLTHSAATAAFLWIAAPPMLEKLKRIKIKYGMIT